MRALPADSLEYFGETALGKTALPIAGGPGTVVVAGLAVVAAAGFAEAGDGAVVGLVTAAGVDAGAADASEPHSALRESFHFMPLRLPAVCAALYLVLHSCIVSA
jgi:hypothetical protein